MNLKVVFILLTIFCFVAADARPQHREFNIIAYYKVLASESVTDINTELIVVRETTLAEKEAYEGALLMKKSGLLTKAKDKISVFKDGRQKLESCISKNRDNTEFRFLRLIIQEHAPKIVKYQGNLKDDKQIILANFKTLSSNLQQVVLDYSKQSTVLKIP
jgi:hypothetical protein